MLGQSIGPVFGGIISQYLGIHAIFWFLFGLGGLALLLILLMLPETQRDIAGNGTVRLQGIHRPLIYSFSPPEDALLERESPPKKRFTIRSIIDPLKLLREKDVIMTLLFGPSSTLSGVWSHPARQLYSKTYSTLTTYKLALSSCPMELVPFLARS